MPFDWKEYLRLNSDLKALSNFSTAWYHWIHHGIAEGRPYQDKHKPRVLKIFLMTKDEPDLLEDWIVYHGRLVGYDNLYIIDNHSQDSHIQEEIYPRYKSLGVHLIVTDTDLNQRAHFITQEMIKVLPQCDFVLKMDTDEFLALSPDGQTLDHDPVKFQQYLNQLPITGAIYKVSLVTSPAIYPQPTHQPWWPAQEMTKFGPLEKTTMKSMFTHTLTYCDLGAHQGRVLDQYQFLPPIETQLAWVHLHKTTFQRYIDKARQVLYSHQYISPHQTPAQQLPILIKLSNQTSLRSIHKVDIYRRYLLGELTKEEFYRSPTISQVLSFDLFSWLPTIDDQTAYIIYCPRKHRYWQVDHQANQLVATSERQMATHFRLVSTHDYNKQRRCFQVVYLPQQPDAPLVDDHGQPGRHIFSTPEGVIKTDGDNRQWAHFYLFGTITNLQISVYHLYSPHNRPGWVAIDDDNQIIPTAGQPDKWALYPAGSQTVPRYTLSGAIKNGNIEMVKQLLTSGPEGELLTAGGAKKVKEYIQLAVDQQQWDIYHYLFDWVHNRPDNQLDNSSTASVSDDPEDSDDYLRDWTPEEALRHGNLVVFQQLITTNTPVQQLCQLIELAIKQQQYDIYDYLLECLKNLSRH